MQDLERATTTGNSTISPRRSRQATLHLPPDDPFISVDVKRRVISEAKRQIEKRRARHEFVAAGILKQQLDKFEELTYSFDLGLFLSATTYFFNEDDDNDPSGAIPMEIHTYGDLFKYLEAKPNSKFCAQILSFVHGTEIVNRLKQTDKWYSEDRRAMSMSFVQGNRISAAEMLFQVTFAMVRVILGNIWDIDDAHLGQLFSKDRERQIVQAPRRIHLPSDNSSLGIKPTGVCLEQIPILQNPMMFQSDNEVYTARPHCAAPGTNPINVLCSSYGNDNSYRMITSCVFPEEIEQVPTAIRELSNFSDHSGSESIALSPRFALGAIKRKSLKAHCSTLNDFSDSLEKIKYQSRSDPSIAKLEWLLYAKDCIEKISQSTTELERFPPEWSCPSDVPWEEWSRDFDKERQLILAGARDLLKEIKHVRNIMKETIDVSSGARGTLLIVIAAIFVPLDFTTSIFGMNLSEINSSLPRYWHVLLVGIPLAVLTVLLPLYFNALWRFSYRTLPELRRASNTPFSHKILMCINFSLAAVTVTLCGTTKYFKWGPVVGFVTWASFASFVSWIRQSRLFWMHWFVAMLVLLVLVLLVFASAAVWSILPIVGYWVLRDYPSLKDFFADVKTRVRRLRTRGGEESLDTPTVVEK